MALFKAIYAHADRQSAQLRLGRPRGQEKDGAFQGTALAVRCMAHRLCNRELATFASLRPLPAAGYSHQF